MKRKGIIISVLLIITIVLSIVIYNTKTDKNYIVNKTLKNKYYSYLPKEAKEYVEKVYEETGEFVKTEKNKEENKPYLNPEYIDYLELNDKEKEDINLIPDTYITDYSINQTYGDTNLPSSFDLRNINNHNFVSPIKNQGTTSICWAFSSIENVETLYMKNKNQSYSNSVPKFSIRQMDYITSTMYDQSSHSYLAIKGNWSSGLCPYSSGCSWTSWDNAPNGSHELDQGGNFFVSSIAMANGITLTNESVMPWHETKKPALVNDIYGYDKSLYEVDSTIQMSTINEDHPSAELVESYANEVKTNMMEYGGPYVGTYSPESTCAFQNVDGSIVLKTDDCINNTNNNDLGHAMQIIGWDNNYNYSYCESGTTHKPVNSNGRCSSGTLTTGKGAWILRNSWGTETPEDQKYSYVYLTYDSTRLSIAFTKSISEMQNRTWDNNYHSNPWIEKNVSNGLGEVGSQTKEFNTHNDNSEKIEKIKFLTLYNNGKYKISVSTNNNTYNSVGTITTAEAGIYTIDLSDKNIILNNKSFSVKIETQNGAKIIYDSISVFTSNTNNNPSLGTNYISGIETYEDPNGKPSDDNIAFITSTGDTTVKLEHYLKNISDYKKISYKAILNGVDYSQYFFNNYNNITSNMTYVDGVVKTTLDISKERYSDIAVCGKTYTFQILYNNVVIESFPLKRICNNWDNNSTDYTTSKIKFHKNDGSDYYSTITKNDTTSFKIMKSDGTGNTNIGDESKFFQYDKYIKSWNTKPDGSGTSYTNNNYFVYRDMDLYAQWSNPETEPHKYTISWQCNRYICNQSQIMSNNTQVTFNKEFTIPNNSFTNLTAGQEFIYWTFDSSDESKGIYYEEEKVMNLTEYGFESPYNNDNTESLEAVWSNSYHSVNFDSNNGTGAMKGIKIINGKTARLKYNLFERPDYVFVGWNTKADGTGTAYDDGQNISLTEDITLYAQWVAGNKYTVTFYANNGSNDSRTQDIPESMTMKLRKNTFTKVGYSFTGWNTKTDGTGTSYTDEQNVSLTSDLTLYAQWKNITPANLKVSYKTHVQTYGWQNYVSNGAMSGTQGEAKRLEGIKIKLENQPFSGDIEYRTHIQSYGWEQNYKKNDDMSGTSGEAKRLEAIQIRLTGEMATYYDVYYRVHAQTFGWLGWARNNEEAGTAGYAKRLEGIEIKLVPKGTLVPGYGTVEAFKRKYIEYRTHVQSYGWQDYVADGEMSGTSGEAKRLEGIQILLNNPKYEGSVLYRTHIQSYGWEQNYKKNDDISGTSGEAKRLEAIQILLTGEMANKYDIYYRVHAQTYGWLAWAKNGESAGTEGLAKRLEGIEIVLVDKGESPPVRANQNNDLAYIKN